MQIAGLIILNWQFLQRTAAHRQIVALDSLETPNVTMLGYEIPTEDQSQAKKAFVSGRDIFVIMPTDSAKSVCLIALPLVSNYIRSRCCGASDRAWGSIMHMITQLAY